MTVYTQISQNNWPSSKNQFDDYLVLNCPFNQGLGLSDAGINAGTKTIKSAKTLTAFGGAAISTTQSKFYGASAQFASGQRLTCPDSGDWNIGATFTVEFWLYRTGSTRGHIVGQYDYPSNSSGSWTIEVDGPGLAVGANKLFLGVLDIGGADKNYNCTYSNSNQWDHIAVTRVNNATPMIFINGVSQSVTTAGGSGSGQVADYALPLAIGGEQDGAYGFTGYLQDLRIYKGVAKYTANFTPPSSILGPS